MPAATWRSSVTRASSVSSFFDSPSKSGARRSASTFLLWVSRRTGQVYNGAVRTCETGSRAGGDAVREERRPQHRLPGARRRADRPRLHARLHVAPRAEPVVAAVQELPRAGCVVLALIVFDRRGTGLSDRILALGSFEEMMDDIRAVMDAVGSERAALLGGAEGGPICALFAATFPERTSALVLVGVVRAADVGAGLPLGARRRRRSSGSSLGYETNWGHEGLRPQRAGAVGRRGRAIRGVVRAGLPLRRHAVVRPRVVPGHDGDRRPRRPARDPRADARAPPLRATA